MASFRNGWFHPTIWKVCAYDRKLMYGEMGIHNDKAESEQVSKYSN